MKARGKRKIYALFYESAAKKSIKYTGNFKFKNKVIFYSAVVGTRNAPVLYSGQFLYQAIQPPNTSPSLEMYNGYRYMCIVYTMYTTVQCTPTDESRIFPSFPSFKCAYYISFRQAHFLKFVLL